MDKNGVIKYVSLFSGIGGFELGIQRASISSGIDSECVFSSEIDKHAQRIYKKNFGVMPHGDITQINARDVPDHDILVGGFPCQSFSIAGKQRGIDDTRGTLFFEIARIAREKQPRLLVLENVKGLLSNDKGNTFLTFLSTLDEIGYDVEWSTLNTKWWLPQNRERVYIVGHLRGSRISTFPVLPILRESEGNDEVQPTESGKRAWLPCLTTRYGERWIGEGYVRQRVRGIDGSDLYRGNVRAMLTPDRLEKRQNGRRFKNIDEEMFTITAQDVHGITYEDNEVTMMRKLTPSECEALQGFPRGWTSVGTEEDPKINARLRKSFLTTYRKLVTKGIISE